MKAFNLTDALEGKPVITRNGIAVTGIKKMKHGYKDLDFAVDIAGKRWIFKANGIAVDGKESEIDLFMLV